MEDAKGLMRSALRSGKSLKPLDAIHLATAKRMGVQAIHSYDDKMMSYAAVAACKIEPPKTDSLIFPTDREA